MRVTLEMMLSSNYATVIYSTPRSSVKRLVPHMVSVTNLQPCHFSAKATTMCK